MLQGNFFQKFDFRRQKRYGWQNKTNKTKRRQKRNGTMIGRLNIMKIFITERERLRMCRGNDKCDNNNANLDTFHVLTHLTTGLIRLVLLLVPLYR